MQQYFWRFISVLAINMQNIQQFSRKDFKYFQFFKQSEAMVAILDLRQCHCTTFWKCHMEYHIKVWSNLTQWFLRIRSECKKLKDDRCQVMGKANSSFWLQDSGQLKTRKSKNSILEWFSWNLWGWHFFYRSCCWRRWLRSW